MTSANSLCDLSQFSLKTNSEMATPFIGFDQFVDGGGGTSAAGDAFASSRSGGSAQQSSSEATEPLYTGGDGELAVLCKKLSKKDVTTKVKGLVELRGMCSTKPAPVLRKVVPHWIHMYGRLCYDRDRRVREQLNVTLDMLVRTVPRAFSNRIDHLIGPWWVSMSDSCPEVSAAACAAFDALYDQQQRHEAAGVLRVHFPALAQHLKLVLGFRPADLAEAKLCSKDDAAEVYERLMGSVFSCIARLAVERSATGVEDYGLDDVLQGSMWRFLRDKDFPLVRREAYNLLSVICREAPAYVQRSSVLAELSPLAFGMLDESYAPNLESMWECLLGFIRACPAECWRHVNCNKAVFPKLLQLLRAGKIPLQFVLPLIATLRVENTRSFKAGSAKLYKDWLEAIWQSAVACRASPERHSAALVAIVECSLFVLLCQREEEKPDDTTGVLNERVASAMSEYFLRTVRCFLDDHAEAPNCRAGPLSPWFQDIATALASALSKLGSVRSGDQRCCVAQFCPEALENIVWGIVQERVLSKPTTDAAPSANAHGRALASADRIVLLLSMVIHSAEGSSVTYQSAGEVFHRVLEECCKTYHEDLSLTVEFVIGVAPLLKSRSGVRLFAKEYEEVASGQTAVLTCLQSMLARDNVLSSKDVIMVLQLVREIAVEAFEVSAHVGLTYWREAIRLCTTSPSGQEVELAQLALEHATPDPRGVFARHGTIMSHDAIDEMVFDFWVDENRGSAVDSFLGTCFGRPLKSAGRSLPLPWPLVSKETLARCIQYCVDRGSRIDVMNNISKIMDCASPKGTDAAPHVEEALQLKKVDLVQLMFHCRLLKTGPAFWDKHVHFVSSLNVDSFVQDLALQLRAVLDGETGDRHLSKHMTVTKWANQVHTLDALLKSATQRTLLFRTVGLMDVSLWKQLAMQVDSQRGRVCDEPTTRAWNFLRALLEAAEVPTMLTKLHKVQAEPLLPPLIWNMLVAGSTIEPSAVAPSPRRRVRMEKFVEVPVAAMMGSVLDSFPANSDVVDFIASRLHRTSDGALLQEVLLVALDDICSVEDNSRLDYAIRRLEVLHYLLGFLVEERRVGETSEKQPRENNKPAISAGSKMWYEVRSPSGAAAYEPVRVDSVEVDDTRQYYTIISDSGKQRQTVAERLHIAPPDLLSEGDARERMSTEGQVTLLSSIISVEQRLREAPGGLHALLTTLGAFLPYLCMRLVGTTEEATLAAFLSDACSYWTALLIDTLDGPVGDHSHRTIMSGLAMTVVLLAARDATGQLDLQAQRNRLISKVLSSSVGTTGGDGPSGNFWYQTSTLRLVTCLVSRSGSIACDDSIALWQGVSRWFELMNDRSEVASNIALKSEIVWCTEALLMCSESDATTEEAYFALRALVPTFVDLSKPGMGAKDTTFRGIMGRYLLSKCISLLASTISSRQYDTIDFGLNLHDMASLCDRLQNNPNSAVKLSAFSILNTCVTSTLAAEPFSSGAVAGAAAGQGGSSAIDGEDSDPTQLAQRHVPKSLWPLLHAAGSLSPEHTEDEIMIGGVTQCTFLETILPWLLLLKFLEDLISREEDVLSRLAPWIKALPMFTSVLEMCALSYREHTELLGRSFTGRALYGKDIEKLPRSLGDEGNKDRYHWLAGHVMYRTIYILPAMARQWWSNDCPRSLSTSVQRFVEMEISESLARREVSKIQSAGSHGTFTMHGSSVSREITAVYIKDECSLEVVIRLPLAYPLRNVEVECRRRLGVSESRWRRWVLQIITLLSTQDGTVLEAILLWKRNVDKEFEGLEPCPICYSIVHPRNFSLPSIVCQTCNNKFHPDCLYKWFNTSHKNKCPLCQQAMNM